MFTYNSVISYASFSNLGDLAMLFTKSEGSKFGPFWSCVGDGGGHGGIKDGLYG